MNFANFLRTAYITEHLLWLLLMDVKSVMGYYMLTQFNPLLFSKIYFDKFETAIARLFVRNTLRGRTFLNYRSSYWRCYLKIAVLKNFVKFIGKHLCQSLLFNKVAGLRPTTLLKRDSGTGVFL